jgi:hypothetical protein
MRITPDRRAPRPLAILLTLTLLAVAPACDGGSSPPVGPGDTTPATITRLSGDDQHAAAASAVPAAPIVVVRNAAGAPLSGVTVNFQVVSGDGWVTKEAAVTDVTGAASTDWYTGPRAGADNRLRAAAGVLATEFTATATPLVPGAVYSGAGGYAEMMVGELPIIVSAPHGGALRPASIPDRSGPNIVTIADANTEELARDIFAAFNAETGSAPTVIIMRLHRSKLDANRDIGEAALGNAEAERAWREFHGYIEAARAALVATATPGLYIDLHGHGHDIQRLELGYRLTANDLTQPDDMLNSAAMVQKSSMRAHVQRTASPHAEVIRGAGSFGTLFELHGYPSVPSASQPHPAGAPYFTGGYNTQRHASQDGSLITGFQIEANREGVRDTATNRRRFADALVTVIQAWNPSLVPAAASLATQ